MRQLRLPPATAVAKFGYMLESPRYPVLLEKSKNASGDADNQQGSHPDEGLTPQRLHAELLGSSFDASRAYLLGALHDSTRSSLHKTVRFGQSNVGWLQNLQILLEKLGQKSWMYQALKTKEEQLAYARGYFDTEGGIPRASGARFYIQLVQKNFEDLSALRTILEGLSIRCGKLHVPSKSVDPNLWRFYVLAESQERFAELVSSWHPRKRRDLDRWLDSRRERMKI